MTTRARGRGLLLAVALAALLGVWIPSAHADVGTQGCSSHAIVVVEPGPGPVPICFDGTISGMDALQLAGANPVTYGFSGQGAAVCQLYGVGNPADSSCLIGPGGQYWAYYRAGPGAGGWTYSRAGASTTTVTDGSIEGWRYGTGGAPSFPDYCSVVGCAPPPTDPPATQPPATAAPAAPGAPQAGGSPSGPATPTVLGESATRGNGKADTPGGAKSDGSGADASAAAGNDTKSGTTTTGKDGRTTSATSERKQRGDTVEVAAGGSGGGDGGSPIGVVVALAVVVVAVAGGLLLRRRRRGPTPG